MVRHRQLAVAKLWAVSLHHSPRSLRLRRPAAPPPSLYLPQNSAHQPPRLPAHRSQRRGQDRSPDSCKLRIQAFPSVSLILQKLERGNPSPTHTSQAPLSVEITLPSDTAAASNKYRSTSDPTAQKNSRFLLIDTPGHGKLRHFASAQLVAPQNLKGIIYLVDAANLSSDSAGVSGSSSSGLTEAAEYLHDILLALQKRYTNAKTSKGPRETPVLIAANKMDLFTALPAPLVKAALEAEITRVRDTRAKGLLDSGIGMDEDGDREERDWLGDGGEGKFTFKQMEEVNVVVEVKGGNVVGGQGGEVGEWWEWISRQL